VNQSVAEIADQYRAAQRAEIRGRLHDAPRRVQRAARREVLLEIASRIVHIDHAESRAGDVVVFCRVLHRVSDEQVRADCLDAERCEAGGNRRIVEAAGHRDLREVSIEDVDLVVMEVGGIEKVGAVVCREREAFVYGAACAVVEHGECVGRSDGGRPCGDGAAFAREDECGDS
jgi:hypothetical protein